MSASSFQLPASSFQLPSNIAKGAGRGSDPDFARFLWYSMGSCNEFESDLILGGDVKLIPGEVLTRLGNEVSEVRQVLMRLIQTVDPTRSREARTGKLEAASRSSEAGS